MGEPEEHEVGKPLEGLLRHGTTVVVDEPIGSADPRRTGPARGLPPDHKDGASQDEEAEEERQKRDGEPARAFGQHEV
jgi:hypothetical protein